MRKPRAQHPRLLHRLACLLLTWRRPAWRIRRSAVNATSVQRQRLERLIAEMIALSELVMIDESMPTPHTTRFSSSS
ncbi:hypothetical protein PG2022B_0331 [Bifidobacterium animalis subsp. animalis]|nr:hypothetical protein PG2022B_0331 [Bifidobacterium animalis subsp. animalis]